MVPPSIFILIFLFLETLRAEEILQLNTTSRIYTLPAGGNNSFSLIAPQEIQQSYLIFDTEGIGEEISDPDIYISTVQIKLFNSFRNFQILQ